MTARISALALTAILASLFSFAEPVRLFRPVPSDPASIQAQSARPALFEIDPAATAALTNRAQSFEVPLPNGQAALFETHTLERVGGANFVARGLNPDNPSTEAVFSVFNGAVAGHIETPAGRFSIIPAGVGRVSLSSAPSTPDGFCGTPSAALEPARPDSAPLVAASAGAAVPEIDLLVLYTKAALQGAGDEAGLRAQVEYFMAELHRAFDRSVVSVKVNVVGYLPTTYQESGDPIGDVGQMPSFAAAARADFKADFVLLLIERADDAVVGVALGIPGSTGNSNLGYTVFRRPASDGLVVSHELGHLFGCAHDRRTDPFSNSAFPYSRGHRFEADGVTYITLMSYRPGVRIHNFSNPDVLFRGVPTGIPEGRTDSANNAKTINLLAPRVALYQQASSRIEFSAPSFHINENAGLVEIPLRRTGDLSAAASVTVSPVAGTAANGTHFIYTSQLISFAPGESTKPIRVQLLDNALADGPRSFDLTLSRSSTGAGLGMIASTRVTIDDDEPLFVFAQTNLTLREGRSANLTLRLLNPTTAPRSVTLAFDGTATATDFRLSATRLDFLTGDSEITISLEALADGLSEPDEQLLLHLQLDNATPAQGPGATCAIQLRDADRPGLLDPDYRVPIPSGLADGVVRRLLSAPDGGLFCAGSFSGVTDRAFSGLLKLSPDGSIDTAFPAPRFTIAADLEAGFEYGMVTALARQPDGKLLLGGSFAGVNGQRANNIVRLLPDGAIDDTFAVGTGFDGEISQIAVQADGQILVAGGFGSVNGTARDMLARLLPTGALDATFNARLGPPGYGAVSVAALPSGEVLVGGYFETVAGVSRPSFARLSAGGQLVRSISYPVNSGVVSHIHLLPDGRFYLAGNFRDPNPQIARFHPDGRWDDSFRTTPFAADVLDILPFPDGRLLVAGSFVQNSLATRNALALLLGDGTPDLAFDAGLGPQSIGRRLSPTATGDIYLAGTIRADVDAPWQRLGRLTGLPVRPQLLTTNPEVSPIPVAAVPGLNHILETSPNLRDWTPLATNRFDTLLGQFPAVAPSPPSLFLRLRLAPPF